MKHMNEPFLTQTGSGTWWLEVYDNEGHSWIVAEFNENGISLVTSIPWNTGWNLDSSGRLNLVDRKELLDI